jgi:hypothetical protein
MSFFEHLRVKPSHVKAHYSFGIAGIITGIIAIVWVSTLPARFDTVTQKAEVQEEKDFGSFITEAKSELGNLINWNGEAIDQTMKQIDPDSALGKLGTNDSTQPSEGFVVEENTDVKDQKGQEIKQENRVILIATTTASKPE